MLTYSGNWRQAGAELHVAGAAAAQLACPPLAAAGGSWADRPGGGWGAAQTRQQAWQLQSRAPQARPGACGRRWNPQINPAARAAPRYLRRW